MTELRVIGHPYCLFHLLDREHRRERSNGLFAKGEPAMPGEPRQGRPHSPKKSEGPAVAETHGPVVPAISPTRAQAVLIRANMACNMKRWCWPDRQSAFACGQNSGNRQRQDIRRSGGHIPFSLYTTNIPGPGSPYPKVSAVIFLENRIED